MAFANQVQAQETVPVISFKENSIDFGDIVQGQKVEHTFVLTNTGKQPLIISNVAATCGCTVPSWPKEPVAPGKSAEIKDLFNDCSVISRTKWITSLSSVNQSFGLPRCVRFSKDVLFEAQGKVKRLQRNPGLPHCVR